MMVVQEILFGVWIFDFCLVRFIIWTRVGCVYRKVKVSGAGVSRSSFIEWQDIKDDRSTGWIYASDRYKQTNINIGKS